MMKEPPASRLRRKPNPATRKLKLVCSFNGAFCLRPPSNKLRYIGGETRIVSVDRNIGFSKLRSKIFDLCPKLRSFSLKYQLLVPGFGRARDPDIDSDPEAPLVSIFSDDDVRCMIDEYEKLELHGKHARLWVFVCTESSKNDYGGGDDKYGSFNTDNIDNGSVKENGDLFGNYLASDGLRRGAQLCRVEFNEKVNKNPVKNVDVGRIRCNDDSLRKMVLRQQLLAKQSECIHRVRGVNCGSRIEFATRGENNQIYDHPLCNLASEPQEDLHQGNMTGCGIENAHLQGGEICVSLAQYPNSRLHPLNPRDGNLYVEKHCLSGYNRHGTGICAWNMNHLHNSKVIPMCDYDPKQDFEISGHGAPCNLNRENIMPWVMRCCCNSQWVGSGYPVRSPSASERVWGGNQNGVRNHRFAMDARNPRVYPYQIRNNRSNQGIVRLDGRLSAAKCYPGLNTNSHFSKQGQPTGLHCSNPRKPGLTENVMEGRTGSGVSLFGNSNSKDCQLACGGAAAAVEAMESQQDLLTGSLYESHEVPYPGVCENYCSVSINNEQFTFKQHKVDSNEQSVGDNDKLMDTRRGCSFFIHLKNGTDYLESGVASSVDLMDNLSLLTMKGGEHPAPSSLASSDVTNSLLKPQSEPLGLMDGELITVSNANKAVATNSSVLNAVSLQKDRVQEEEIQQDQPSGLSINEKDETKQSIKCSKVTGGISSDLVAFYTHLATRELQTIKNSDLEYVKELGSGTYGTVYYGKWKGSDVAIKKIKPSCFTEVSLEEDRLVADFWKEAHILGQLHHPNIVAFYGVVTDGPMNNLATVTEYMVNGSLKQVLRRKDRTIDRRKRIILAMDAAFGMEYLHEKNIVHFDLKSHNFLVNMKDPQRPVCKIGDLGLSKIKQRTLVSGGVRGTIPWMAPELLNSNNNMVTEKVDVFSFGIVMWELLTGEEPYSNMRSEEIIAGIIKGTLRPEIPSWCDPAWRSLMERCWSSDPESRPSFSEIAKELRTMSAAMNIK